MTIDEQLELFYRKLRETISNSRITPEDALARINDSRRSIAVETKFYQVEDSVTAVGSETSWTLRDDFIEPVKARDWATCNGKPVVMKDLSEWATITNGAIIPQRYGSYAWGMLDGKQFHRYPAASPGDVMKWRGAGIPPDLPATTGPDAYTDDIEAELIVLDAVIDALEDINHEPGPRLIKRYDNIKREVKRRARPRGARRENAPEDVWP